MLHRRRLSKFKPRFSPTNTACTERKLQKRNLACSRYTPSPLYIAPKGKSQTK